MKERCYTIDDGSGEQMGIIGRNNVLEHIAAILDDADVLEDGEQIEITIHRHDLTRKEIDALPEV